MVVSHVIKGEHLLEFDSESSLAVSILLLPGPKITEKKYPPSLIFQVSKEANLLSLVSVGPPCILHLSTVPC